MNTETAATPAPRQTTIAKLVRKRDALGRRHKIASQRAAEADVARGLAWNKDASLQAIFKDFYDDAFGREMAADDKLAEVCRAILLSPPTSANDLTLKGQTVAFIAAQGDIWEWDDFRYVILAFSDQVASWSGEGRHV